MEGHKGAGVTRTNPSAAWIACNKTAAAQHGLLTREQALAAGLARWVVDKEIARGTWIPMRPGVYRSATAPVTWHQRALAACIGHACALAVSHRSAAFLHGLLTVPPEPVDVTTCYGGSTAGLGRVARPHRVRHAPGPGEIVTLCGLPATSLVRTLGDLAGRTRPAELVELVDRAFRSLNSDAARRRLLRALQEPAQGRSGACALREALGPWTDIRVTGGQLQSVLEAQVLRLLTRVNVPRPVLQHEVMTADGDRYFLDFAWPSSGVALEVDGYAFHSDRRTFTKDRVRGNRLLVEGWQVLHTTFREIRDTPETLVESLLAALREV
jgi:hypothetical protein